MTQNEKIMDKVKKLFNLARNNPNEHEAQAALNHAKKILDDYGLEYIETKSQEEQDDFSPFGTYVAIPGASLPMWKSILASVVSNYFNVGAMILKKSNMVSFYGAKINVTASVEAFNQLINQIDYLATKYDVSHLTRGDSKNAKNQYRLGLVHGFHRRWLNEQAKAKEASNSCVALAKCHKGIQADFLAQNNVHLKKEPVTKITSQGIEHRVAGIKDSSKLQIHKGALVS